MLLSNTVHGVSLWCVPLSFLDKAEHFLGEFNYLVRDLGTVCGRVSRV